MISVCLASYNGEKYIKEQLTSILKQLSEDDELIVSDDGSTDSTLKIVSELASAHPQIKLINGPRKGVIRNFEHAIHMAKGEIIFLSDQDDIWENDKVKTVLQIFNSSGDNCVLVLHDAEISDENGIPSGTTLFRFRNSRPGLVKCLWKNPYVGCCMAFRSSLKREILPFPGKIEMHDWWIALNAECGGRTRLISDRLIRYRRHSGNVSEMHHHPLKKMVFNRLYFVHVLAERRFRLFYEKSAE